MLLCPAIAILRQIFRGGAPFLRNALLILALDERSRGRPKCGEGRGVQYQDNDPIILSISVTNAVDTPRRFALPPVGSIELCVLLLSSDVTWTFN